PRTPLCEFPFLQAPPSARHPPSFPTRRSSDLLAHQAGRDINKPTTRASETHSLQPGTSAWSGFGLTTQEPELDPAALDPAGEISDRKSTRLNSSHVKISYAVFCLKKKNHMLCC